MAAPPVSSQISKLHSRVLSKSQDTPNRTSAGARDVLDRLVVLVVRIALRLAAPLLVARDGAEVGHLDDDGVERARVRGRVRVCVRGEREAAAASISWPESRT